MSVIEDTNPYARQFLLVVLSSLIIVGLVQYFLADNTLLQIVLTFLLLGLLIYCIAMTLLIYRRAIVPLSVPLLLAGVVYIVGGAAFDITATLIHTPRLDLEGNPLARVLLDNGFAVPFVYAFSGIAQLMLAVLSCLMWAAFLRHVPEVVKSAHAANAQSAAQFVKAAGGAAHLSWRQWFFPFHIREFPRAYHSLWFVIVVWMGAQIGRWYLGLDWFDIVPYVNLIIIGLIGTLVSLTIYISWLVAQYRAPVAQAPGTN